MSWTNWIIFASSIFQIVCWTAVVINLRKADQHNESTLESLKRSKEILIDIEERLKKTSLVKDRDA